MTTKQERRLNMYHAVRDYLILNEGISKDLPYSAVSLEALQRTIEQIHAAHEMQIDIKTGITKEKNELKDKLIIIAADNSRKIAAFAKFSGNLILLEEVRFSITRLKRMTDIDLKIYAGIIYNKTEENVGMLSEYGINIETQKIFNDTINSYYNSIGKPRTGIIEKSQATRQLGELFRKALSILEDLDAAVGIIRLKEPGFYYGYKTIRKLVYTSAGKLALKAKVLDLSTGEPVKGVILTFRPDGALSGRNKEDGEIVKKTARKGSFHIKHMHAGTYQVVMNKPGYIEKEVTVIVAEGERSQLIVELEKA